ncbi:zinc-binding alcohol dehydrogenase family protein [Alcanivorax quisquiliarum]|uniref:Zinc-type alcohol dehydrogenase-like protein n=1 Tax=Alcanivorax quisquiliarum TaxID=2933565 RepID=A0ABT0E417_9GAMM|nr:zinc-binding alcohol dehydrogenase family protein [Alcanivorax quisquiliarum]MCK0536554.1 zinc-binding alcohol dehydrogenase family protein [Alcanivorax quisquiliarum]
MKAVGYRQSLPIDDPAALEDVTLDTPAPGPRDLLVKVQAVAVNPVDTKIRLSAAPEQGGIKILGWDAVGVVEAVGDAVTLFRPGDAVWYAGDVSRQGCNAEYQCVDERIVGRKPENLSAADAAAMPLTTVTAWELLFDRLGVLPGRGQGKTLLVIGAGGGVGSVLVQLARQLTGLTVIGTASRDATRDWVLSLGAHKVIDHTRPLTEGLAQVGIEEVDYVASLTHTDAHVDEIVAALRPQGRLGLIDDPMALDVRKFKRKSISLHWEFMYTRSLFQTDDQIRQHRILMKAADLVEQGVVRSTATEHYGAINAENLRRAHALMESHQARGKVVLEGF